MNTKTRITLLVWLFTGLAALGWVLWSRNQADKIPVVPKLSEQRLWQEVIQLAHRETRSGEFSWELIERMESDVDWVIVGIGLEEAKIFPRLLQNDCDQIQALVKTDSAAALKHLQKCVYDALTARIAERGEDPKLGRKAWANNNGATALLLIYLPLAEHLDKKTDMIREYVGASPQRGSDGWQRHVPGDHQDWWRGDKWPFQDTPAPWYWN